MEDRIAGIRKNLIVIIGIIFIAFHLYTATFGVLDGLTQRNLHLSMMLVLVFLIKPADIKHVGPIYDFLLICATVAIGCYMHFASADMAYRAGTVYTIDKVCCVILMVLIIIGVKRVMGWVMPIISIVMLAYVFLGQYLPQPFGHAPYSMKKITSLMYMGTEGIWSSPIAASATFIPLFILFGCLLEAFGGGEFFMDISSALFGKYRGGPAKVAVISSGLMGSISGSAVANVTTTGAFTIPLMKKMGYDKDFAGAVEATASTGGQLAPPVMGAAAFLMAEILSIPYSTIVKAAIIPALIYYCGCFFVVDFEAGRLGLSGLKKEELPVTRTVLRKGWFHMLPLVILIYMLVFMGTSALKASTWAVGITFVIGLITAPKNRELLVTLRKAVAAIILGMGLPTVAAYSILVTLIVSTLVKLDVEPLAAHMFIFYFGIISNVTPPVALAAYAAAGLSGGSALRTGIKATRLALAGFLLPFVMIYAPEILMIGQPADILMVGGTALLGVYALAVASIGFFFTNCKAYERLLCGVSGIMMVVPNTVISLIGLVILVIVGVVNRRRAKHNRVHETA